MRRPSRLAADATSASVAVGTSGCLDFSLLSMIYSLCLYVAVVLSSRVSRRRCVFPAHAPKAPDHLLCRSLLPGCSGEPALVSNPAGFGSFFARIGDEPFILSLLAGKLARTTDGFPFLSRGSRYVCC
jgi:hypothetical protein